MVVLQHIEPLGLTALTLSSRGAGWQEQKHPQIHPHLWDGGDLGFPTSRLLAILNGYVMDQHRHLPHTLSWQSFHATAHRLRWEKGPWWRSTGCWRTWWQHLCIHLHPATKISLKSGNHYLKLQMIMCIYWCKFIQRRHLRASKPDAFLGRPANCKASKSGMLETIMQRSFTSQPQSTSALPYFSMFYIILFPIVASVTKISLYNFPSLSLQTSEQP